MTLGSINNPEKGPAQSVHLIVTKEDIALISNIISSFDVEKHPIKMKRRDKEISSSKLDQAPLSEYNPVSFQEFSPLFLKKFKEISLKIIFFFLKFYVNLIF